jgi:hypothetical protein
MVALQPIDGLLEGEELLVEGDALDFSHCVYTLGREITRHRLANRIDDKIHKLNEEDRTRIYILNNSYEFGPV